MERLSSLDASFLRVETPNAHMHVGWLALLKLPGGSSALDVGELRKRIEGRLHLAPSFRQRVINAPLGEPVLVDDPRFRIDDHVLVAEGDGAPISDHGLREISDRFLSTPLERDRPLWQIEVVPRVRGRRAALLGKIHHALVDGVAAVELGLLLFDPAPHAAPPEPVDWEPQPPTSPARLLLDSAADSAVEQFRSLARLGALGLQPRRTLRLADTMRRAAFKLAEQVGRPAPSSYLNREIGPGRTLLVRSVPFSRLDRLKRRHEVKLNDVVLAVAAGALRRYACLRDEQPSPLRAMVPINVRREGEAGEAGNRIVFGFVDLPIDEPNAFARVALIHRETARLKQGDLVSGNELLMASVGQLPAPLKTPAARLAGSPRLFNLAISNVPGPRRPLYAAGSRVESIYPVIPLSEGHALAIGVLSYGERLHFALHADPAVLDECDQLPGLVESAISELEAGHSPAKRERRTDHRRSERQFLRAVQHEMVRRGEPGPNRANAA